VHTSPMTPPEKKSGYTGAFKLLKDIPEFSETPVQLIRITERIKISITS